MSAPFAAVVPQQPYTNAMQSHHSHAPIPQSRLNPQYRMSGSAMAPAVTAQQKSTQFANTPTSRSGSLQPQSSQLSLNSTSPQQQRAIAPLPSHVHTSDKPRPGRTRLYSEDSERMQPYKPIAKTQALMTTYPTRLRTGTTTLMQPINVKVQQQTAKEAAKIDYGSGKRLRTQVNYAELEALDDLEVDSGDESTSTNAAASAGPSGATLRQKAMAQHKKAAELAAAASSSARSTPPPSSATNAPPKALPPDRSYLGEQPPGNMILIEPARKTRHIYLPQQILEDAAEHIPALVPVRVDIDTDTHRIRDCFLWDSNEASITPEIFAEIFCDDAGLPNAFREQVAVAIRSQLDEFSPVSEIPITPEDDETDSKETDLRVIVNIDVQIQSLRLVDRLEWDLASGLTPENFAWHLCTDLGLTGEAAPIIAHAIHEELIRHKKECIEIGLVGRAEGEERTTQRGPKKMEGIWRDWNDASEFGPRVEEFSVEDLHRLEIERERSSKRVRRVGMPSGNTNRLTRPKR